MPELIAFCLERINAPPIPTTTQDITEHDASESISDPMEVDEVEEHLTRPTTPESEDEEDIAMCLSPEIQEITKEVFMHSRHFAPSTPSRSDALEPPQSPTPARSRITSMTKLSIPGRPKKSIESSSTPIPIPSFSLRLMSGGSVSSRTSKASTSSKSLEAKTFSQSSTSTLVSSSNKENRSPYFMADITSEQSGAVSPKESAPAPVTPTRQGILGKRRSIDMDLVDEDEVVLMRRRSSSVGSGLRMSKARAAKGMKKGSGSGSFSKVSVSRMEENKATLVGSSRDGKSTKALPELKPFPKLEIKDKEKEKQQDTPAEEEESSPQDDIPRSRKRKGVFLDAVELPLRRSVRRRTESMPEPRSSSPAPSTPTTSRTRTLTLTTTKLRRGPTETPRPPVSLRRTRSATRLLGMEATFERLPSTPTKKSKGKQRASDIVGLENVSSNTSEEPSLASDPLTSSSPLRILREVVVANSGEFASHLLSVV